MTEQEHNTALALARLALANDHGALDSDESIANYERAVLLARTITCDHCDVLCAVLPASGAQFVVEQVHEHGCPLHDDETGDAR